jgi:kumamolisin
MYLVPKVHSVRKWYRQRLARFGIIASLVLVLASGFVSPNLFSVRADSPIPPFITLQGSTTPQIASSHFVRHHTSTVPMTIGIMLMPNQLSKMDDLLKQLYDPTSSLYHHWLRKGTVDATFGATLAQQATVKNYLVQAGLHLETSPGSLFVVAAGTSIQLERAFRTTINDYLRSDGSTFFANSTPVQIPQTWQGIVEGVFGLSDAVRNKPLLALQHAQQGRRTQALYGGGPAGGLTPTQIAGIYDANPIYTILGHGVTLGLLEFSGYTPGDAVGYESQFGLATVPQQYIMVNGGPADHTNAMEVALDVEMMAALASSVDRIQLYEAPNSDLGQIWADYQIAQDDTANAISTSWGACEKEYLQQDILSEAQSFKFMALQGQSMFAASGDNGAYDCLSTSIINGTLQVSEVASQPYATAVGGTSLASADPGSNPNPNYPSGKEKAWNDNCTSLTCFSPLGSGGGGGNSRLWQRPTYQVGPGVDETKSKSGSWCKQTAGVPCREIPDVSFNADPSSGYAVYCTDSGDSSCTPSGWIVVGGTSAAAPLCAAIAVLADSYLFAHGRSALGFANPYLYQLNATTGASNVFHDIGKGKGTNGYYPTGAGYDMATGMGSVDVYQFVLQSIFPPFKQSVFIGAGNHWVYALSASTGMPLWHYVTGSTPSTPVVANGTIYVSSDELYALNASNGSLLWRYPFGSVNSNTTPTVVNGVVYAGSSDGNLYAVNASDGTLLWRFQTGGSYVWPPTVDGGVVYTGSSTGYIYALNASNGTLLWQQSVGGSQPVVSNGVIYFTAGLDVEAIKETDGSLLWAQFEGTDINLGTPVVSNGSVYVPYSGDYGLPGGILALNADNGVRLWSYSDTNTSYVYTPLVLNSVVYADFYDGVYSLNAADGTLLWSSTINTSVAILTDAPIISNGILYCGSSDGNIRTINASTGSPIGQYLVSANVGGYLTDPAIAP